MAIEYRYVQRFHPSDLKCAEKARDFFSKRTPYVVFDKMTKYYIDMTSVPYKRIDSNVLDYIQVGASFDNKEKGVSAKKEYLTKLNQR